MRTSPIQNLDHAKNELKAQMQRKSSGEHESSQNYSQNYNFNIEEDDIDFHAKKEKRGSGHLKRPKVSNRLDSKDIAVSETSKKSLGSGFNVSPRAIYPEAIEKANPVLNVDIVADMKKKQTQPINESSEGSQPDLNDQNYEEDAAKRLGLTESSQKRNTMTFLPPEEWKQEKQFHPCLSQFLFLFGAIIVSVVVFYTKVMVFYEHQNVLEAFYAINFLNLLLFGLTNHCRSKSNSKAIKKERLSSGELEKLTNKFNLLNIAKEDRMTFVYISLNMVVGVGLFLQSLLYIDIRQHILILILVFGGVLPSVMNLKVEYWMKY